MSSCNILDHLFSQAWVGFLSSSHLNIWSTTKATVSSAWNSILSAVSNQSWLCQIWVDFYLQVGWLVSSVGEDVSEQLNANVGAADVLDEPSINEFFHSLPGILVWDWVLNHDWLWNGWVVGHAWWVSHVEWNKFQWHWEVNDVQVEVFQSKIFQSLSACSFYVLWSMVCIPKLWGDEKILSLDNTLIDSSLNSLTTFLLISVGSSLVNKSVSSFDSFVTGIWKLVFCSLPCTISNSWHLLARWESDGFLRWSGGFHIFLK